MSEKIFKVFVTQPIPKQALDILNSDNRVKLVINEQLPLPKQTLIDSVRDCDALFCTLNEKIDKDVLNAANFKVIATCSVGYDHVDVNECKSRNIPVGYTPGVLTDATAEHTIGLLLNTTRRVCEAVQAAKNGQWKEWKIMWMCGKGLSGSNVGIFGLGRIGLAVANRLRNFGVNKIMYHNRNKSAEGEQNGYEYVDLNKLLNESDFIICTCSAHQGTEKIFNLKLFEQMKRDTVFINVSRGNVVNQEDLYLALKNNLIKAAGLDVCVPEPLPTSHELFQLDNCVITPHISSAEINTRVKMSTITAQNIINGLNDKQLVHQIQI